MLRSDGGIKMTPECYFFSKFSNRLELFIVHKRLWLWKNACGCENMATKQAAGEAFYVWRRGGEIHCWAVVERGRKSFLCAPKHSSSSVFNYIQQKHFFAETSYNFRFEYFYGIGRHETNFETKCNFTSKHALIAVHLSCLFLCEQYCNRNSWTISCSL